MVKFFELDRNTLEIKYVLDLPVKSTAMGQFDNKLKGAILEVKSIISSGESFKNFEWDGWAINVNSDDPMNNMDQKLQHDAFGSFGRAFRRALQQHPQATLAPVFKYRKGACGEWSDTAIHGGISLCDDGAPLIDVPDDAKHIADSIRNSMHVNVNQHPVSDEQHYHTHGVHLWESDALEKTFIPESLDLKEAIRHLNELDISKPYSKWIPGDEPPALHPKVKEVVLEILPNLLGFIHHLGDTDCLYTYADTASVKIQCRFPVLIPCDKFYAIKSKLGFENDDIVLAIIQSIVNEAVARTDWVPPTVAIGGVVIDPPSSESVTDFEGDELNSIPVVFQRDPDLARSKPLPFITTPENWKELFDTLDIEKFLRDNPPKNHS